ncbi:hypothetical protein SLS56_011906, partial [Neofusicoccum ribis]
MKQQIGISTDRTSAADYDADMQRAKALGIDAFALNFGPDGDANYTQQLVYAYDSAASNDMKVFLSFDFNTGLWSTSDTTTVGARIAAFGTRAGQLMVDNKAFVSTFVGDALDVSALRSAAGIDIFFAPNFNPDYTTKLGGDKTKYMAPVSPWFFTHFGSEVSFGPKNW